MVLLPVSLNMVLLIVLINLVILTESDSVLFTFVDTCLPGKTGYVRGGKYHPMGYKQLTKHESQRSGRVEKLIWDVT